MGSTCELTCLPCVAPYGVGVPPPLWCPHDVHKSTPLVATCLVQWDACSVLSGVNAPTLLVCVYPLFGVHVSATMMPIGRLLWRPWVTCAGVCGRMSEPKRPKMQASCCIVAFLHSWVLQLWVSCILAFLHCRNLAFSHSCILSSCIFAFLHSCVLGFLHFRVIAFFQEFVFVLFSVWVVVFVRSCAFAFWRSCTLAFLRSCVFALLRSFILAFLHSCVLAFLRSCILAILRYCILAFLRSHVLPFLCYGTLARLHS